ncbi:hypothetical protein O6H91_Y247600 [Diphasiastrum complanatum]|nr:hypothetical protein O6H91_Y247600 [Diphasiastrum complanatum]KAJ7299359.1 hypothetical protein O6H91_Y247600 [Diphasiastrum complanatum]
MERGGVGVRVGVGASALRRPRNILHKDLSAGDADGMTSDLHSSRPRERPKKDRLLVTHKTISESVTTNPRSKRRRSELHVQAKEHSICGDVTMESFDEINVETFEEDVGHSPPMPQSSRTARIQDKSDNTAAAGNFSSDFPYVPKIPRRLRTAMLKRPHEIYQSAVVGRQELVVSNDRVHSSFTLPPGSSPGDIESTKRIKHSTFGIQLAKVEADSSVISDEEVEVLEALFDLANQVPHPPPTEIKSESGVKSKNAGDVMHCASAPTSITSSFPADVPNWISPAAHSFGSVSAPGKILSFSAPTAGLCHAEAPKRKRPRAVPTAEAFLLHTTFQALPSAASSVAIQSKELGQANFSNPLKQEMEAAFSNAEAKEDGRNIGLEQDIVGMPTSIHQEGKESSDMILANLTRLPAPHLELEKSGVADCPLSETVPLQLKFQIDLMAPPCTEAVLTSNHLGNAIDVPWLERQQLKDLHAENQEQDSEGNEIVSSQIQGEVQRRFVDSNEHGFCRDCEVKKRLDMSDKSVLELVTTVSQQAGNNVAASTSLSFNAVSISRVCSSMASTSMSMALPGWPKTLPFFGQYDPALEATTASWPASATSLKGASSASENIPFSNQLPSKHCALHVRIARFIKMQQKLSQDLPFASTSGLPSIGNGPYSVQGPLNTTKNSSDNIAEVYEVGNVPRLPSANLAGFELQASKEKGTERKGSKGVLATLSADLLQQQNQQPLSVQHPGLRGSHLKLQMMDSVDPYVGKVNGTRFGGHNGNSAGFPKEGSTPAVTGGIGMSKGLMSMTAAQAQYLQAIIQKNHLPLPFPYNSNSGSLLSGPSWPDKMQAAQMCGIPFYDPQTYRPHAHCNQFPTTISATGPQFSLHKIADLGPSEQLLQQEQISQATSRSLRRVAASGSLQKHCLQRGPLFIDARQVDGDGSDQTKSNCGSDLAEPQKLLTKQVLQESLSTVDSGQVLNLLSSTTGPRNGHLVSDVSSAHVKQLNLENQSYGRAKPFMYSGYKTEALQQSLSSLAERTSLEAGCAVLFPGGKVQSSQNARQGQLPQVLQLMPQSASSGSLANVSASLQPMLAAPLVSPKGQGSQNCPASLVAASELPSALTSYAPIQVSMTLSFGSALKSGSSPELSTAVKGSLSPPRKSSGGARARQTSLSSSASFVRAGLPAQNTSRKGREQQSQQFSQISLHTSQSAFTNQHSAAASLMWFPKLCREQARNSRPFPSSDKQVISEQSQLEKSVFLQQQPTDIQQEQSQTHSHTEQALPKSQQLLETTLQIHNQPHAVSWCSEQLMQQAPSSSYSMDEGSLTGSPALISRIGGHESIQPTFETNCLNGGSQANSCREKQPVGVVTSVCDSQYSRSGSPESVCSLEQSNTEQRASLNNHQQDHVSSEIDSVHKNPSKEEQKPEISGLHQQLLPVSASSPPDSNCVPTVSPSNVTYSGKSGVQKLSVCCDNRNSTESPLTSMGCSINSGDVNPTSTQLAGSARDNSANEQNLSAVIAPLRQENVAVEAQPFPTSPQASIAALISLPV